MPKVAILLAQMYEDLELWVPYYRLKEEGYEVVLVADKAGETYNSKHEYAAKSDVAAGDIKASDFDMVLIPGGFGPDFMRRSKAMMDFVSQAVSEDIPIAAICHGVWMLCHTNALRGKRCTSFFSIKTDIANAGGNWVDQECVVDGELITSRQPSDLPAFCKAVMEALRMVKEPAMSR